MKKYGKVGVIGRWKPLHNGATVMLETLLEESEHVTIGIGSVNKYNLRNPFTKEETKDMLESHLSQKYNNYNIVFIPDYAHIPEFRDGQKWKSKIVEEYGKLDHFYTGNDYVRNLLEDTYEILTPDSAIPREKWVMLKATQVRVALAQNSDWKSLVPERVSKYIVENKLDVRFREEFGLETISQLTDGATYKKESYDDERKHTYEA